MSKINDSTVAIKHDSEKPGMSLLPTDPLMEIARVLDFGATKYAPHNWRKGFKTSRLISAAMRHLTDYNEGGSLDPETELAALAHAGCMILFALEQHLHPELYKKFDDRYIHPKYAVKK